MGAVQMKNLTPRRKEAKTQGLKILLRPLFLRSVVSRQDAFLRRIWTAVAEHGGDTAFARAGRERTIGNFRPHEGGVSRLLSGFPPQSKTFDCGFVPLRLCVKK
jgi:hypothetical protein